MALHCSQLGNGTDQVIWPKRGSGLLVFGCVDIEDEARPVGGCCSAAQGPESFVHHLDHLQRPEWVKQATKYSICHKIEQDAANELQLVSSVASAVRYIGKMYLSCRSYLH